MVVQCTLGKTEKYSFEDVLKIILEDHPQDTLCVKQPMRCRKAMSLLIDTSRVKVQDLPFDDNGSHTWTYKVVGTDPNDVVFQIRKREEPEEHSTQYVYLRRNYRTNKASSDFRQVVSYLEDANGNIINNTALLQYNFKGKEHFFEAKPHGNRKSSSGPFLPTNKTTKEEIRETAGKSKPQKAILKLMKSKDLLSTNSSAETTRDRKQVYNFKRSERLKTTNQQGKKMKSMLSCFRQLLKKKREKSHSYTVSHPGLNLCAFSDFSTNFMTLQGSAPILPTIAF